MVGSRKFLSAITASTATATRRREIRPSFARSHFNTACRWKRSGAHSCVTAQDDRAARWASRSIYCVRKNLHDRSPTTCLKNKSVRQVRIQKKNQRQLREEHRWPSRETHPADGAADRVWRSGNESRRLGGLSCKRVGTFITFSRRTRKQGSNGAGARIHRRRCGFFTSMERRSRPEQTPTVAMLATQGIYWRCISYRLHPDKDAGPAGSGSCRRHSADQVQLMREGADPKKSP